jgi:outer membrane protein W
VTSLSIYWLFENSGSKLQREGDTAMKKMILMLAGFAVLASAPAKAAGDFSLFGAYWDTDVAGDTAGGGIGTSFAFNDVVGLELRATYFEQLSDDALGNVFDSNDPVFRDQSIQVLPVDIGLRFNLGGNQEMFHPYVSAGGSYFLLDSDFGEIKDEVGYYGAVGASFGHREGTNFFAEAIYRNAKGQVDVDPEDLDDIDDIDVNSRAKFDIDGFGVNAGVRWRF